MTQPPKTILRSDRGQSLIEFALTLPMLLVVMFMVTEFGRALFQYNVLAQATREGARVAVVSGPGVAADSGEARMQRFLDATTMPQHDLDLNCAVEELGGEGSGIRVVRATASMPFRWILQGEMPTRADGTAPVTPDQGLVLQAETIMKSETF